MGDRQLRLTDGAPADGPRTIWSQLKKTAQATFIDLSTSQHCSTFIIIVTKLTIKPKNKLCYELS